MGEFTFAFDSISISELYSGNFRNVLKRQKTPDTHKWKSKEETY